MSATHESNHHHGGHCHHGGGQADARARQQQPAAQSAYVCPMHPEETSDRPGECGKCGMALEPAAPQAPGRRTQWTCPMHPEVVRDEPGECPICGMALEPGLYQMHVDYPTSVSERDTPPFQVRFEQRRVEDLDYPDQGPAFEQVRALSEHNVVLYETFLGPWVRLMTNPWSAEVLRQLHPARTSRLMYSERFVPSMGMVRALAGPVQAARRPVAESNPCRQWEALASAAVATGLELAGTLRDGLCELWFQGLYGWPVNVGSAAPHRG